MEFSFPEDSKSSSEETDRSSDQQNYDTVTGRSYECVFCKRGFTTAQALGGHMNIHRKDRAKTKPSFPPSSSSKVVDDNCADLGFHSAIRSSPGNSYSTSSEVNANYHQLIFPSLRPSYTNYGEDFCVQNPRDRNLFGEDWRRSLSLHSNPLSVCENKGKVADSGEKDGLDLELRLGYDP
ncbi:hypothetical protein L6164_010009 [Bauhinia variegata]|uniref:Uncharacterized protein n=1 Tax=Bauhinia variegata TaxID=167791 RepID=A0ACB9PLY8_BAUVA|nr:hypothetical protein L6164_010009 [Bauhinia variegata]